MHIPNHELTLIISNPFQHHSHSSFPPFHICNFLFQLSVYILICSILDYTESSFKTANSTTVKKKPTSKWVFKTL